MACDLLYVVYKDGLLHLQTDAQLNVAVSYVGGQPMFLDDSGKVVPRTAIYKTLSTVTNMAYVGLFLAHYEEDKNIGKATRVAPFQKARLWDDNPNAYEEFQIVLSGSPYDITKIYLAGDLLYVNAITGLLTNAIADRDAGAPAVGIVHSAPTSPTTGSEMQAELFPVTYVIAVTKAV